MWSYWIYGDEYRGRLEELERSARCHAQYAELLRRPRRSLRQRLGGSGPDLSRREWKLVEQNSVVLSVPEGQALEAPSSSDVRQFFLLERGRASMTVDGAAVGELDAGDLVAHRRGLSIRAGRMLRLRVLTPREFAAVREIPALRERHVAALPELC